MVVDDEADGDRIVSSGPDGPVRLCTVTRTPLPSTELIRFVADPAGNVVPDPAGRLPGRGVWIKADRRCVAQGVKSNVFARSLKRSVQAGTDLCEQVDRLLEMRTCQALALANKAGLVVSGFQQVDASIDAGEPVALLHAADGAPGGRDKLDRKFAAIQREKGSDARILAGLTVQQMSLAIGRANVVHAALKPGGAAVKFLSEAGRLARYRSGASATEPTVAEPKSTAT